MKIVSKYYLVPLILFLNLNLFSQGSYYDNVECFRRSFYSIFFNTSLKDDHFIFGYSTKVNYSISTVDSLENPINVELFGKRYFKLRQVPIFIRFKKAQLPKKQLKIEKDYYFFERNKYKYYKNIDTTADGELTEHFEKYLDSLINSDIKKSKIDSSNWIFIKSTVNSRGQNVYFLNTLKTTALLKIKIKKKDLKILKKMHVPKQEVEIWAIQSLISGQFCDFEKNVCFEIHESY